MAVNDFLAWAIGGGANVESQAAFVVDPVVGTGEQTGTANSARANKVWRQASYATYALGQIIVDLLGVNASDDGNIANYLANLKAAITNLGFSTGDLKPTFKTTADLGWIMIVDGTIGSATSGATYANVNALNLYTLIWNGVSNSFAPVTGGRGATAALDFAANKPMALPKMLGRALAISGSGSGLSVRSLGQFLGEETHLMTLAELVTHHHTYTQPAGQAFQTVAQSGASVPASQVANTGDTGSSTPFNVMQPTSFINLMVRL